MADPHTVVDGDVSAERPSEGWTPDLRVSEDLTPLPYVDRALPILGLFAGLVGRGTLIRYRVALLRELAAQPRARMKIWETQESVDWLEPASVTRLMQDLRGRRRPARSSLSEVLRDAGRFDEAVDVSDQAWRTYGTLKRCRTRSTSWRREATSTAPRPVPRSCFPALICPPSSAASCTTG